MAAHLPGMCAAIFPMPVIGIPMHTTSLGGRDSCTPFADAFRNPGGYRGSTAANAGLLAAKDPGDFGCRA